MKNRPTISAFLIVYNEEEKIERCLKSISWVDEIIIVDSASTDRTIEICKKFTDKILVRPFVNYSYQKNFALSKVTSDWALSIDADEEITTDLKNEILEKITHLNIYNAFTIPRHSFIFGREFRFSGTQKDKPIRLFKAQLSCYERPVHEVVEIKGPLGEMQHFMYHYTYVNLSTYLEKFNRYTSLEANYLLEKKHRLRLFDIVFRPPLTFIRLYFWEQGFRDGLEGFTFCCLSACYAFVKHLKYRELLKQKCHGA